MYVCMYVNMYVCMYVCICIEVCVCVCVCVYVCMCVRVCVYAMTAAKGIATGHEHAARRRWFGSYLRHQFPLSGWFTTDITTVIITVITTDITTYTYATNSLSSWFIVKQLYYTQMCIYVYS